MGTKIPMAIAAIIDERREEVRKAKALAEEEACHENAREREMIQAERSKLLIAVGEELPDIVAYVHDDNSRPYEHGETIVFDIPGLTPIRTLAKKQDETWRVLDKFDVVRYEEDYSEGYFPRWWWSDLTLADALLKAGEEEQDRSLRREKFLTARIFRSLHIGMK